MFYAIMRNIYTPRSVRDVTWNNCALIWQYNVTKMLIYTISQKELVHCSKSEFFRFIFIKNMFFQDLSEVYIKDIEELYALVEEECFHTNFRT